MYEGVLMGLNIQLPPSQGWVPTIFPMRSEHDDDDDDDDDDGDDDDDDWDDCGGGGLKLWRLNWIESVWTCFPTELLWDK